MLAAMLVRAVLSGGELVPRSLVLDGATYRYHRNTRCCREGAGHRPPRRYFIL